MAGRRRRPPREPGHPRRHARRGPARRRLHQPVFRARVIQAYTTRCAVCALAHASLLDAAHIAP
ncbi:MAG: HNH endonuclease, partial [Kineosporiaceae bacterium]